jgi:tetrapyrrole methylase family protein / MazG family protein
MALLRVGGLGPGDTDLLTAGTLSLIQRFSVANGFLRTRIHPAASICTHMSTCDDLYETSETFDDVYRAIVERLVAATLEHEEVLYLVPGSPMVAEHTVELLLADPRVTVQLEPALSFVDLTWTRLGIDPVRVGVRIVDGHSFAEDVESFEHPLLISQCHAASVLSDIKLSADIDTFTEIPVATVLHHLGLPDERIETVAWPDLDRIASTHAIVADHLTSLYVPKLVSSSGSAIGRLQTQMQALRDRCPWDREQTHESLARYAVEEAYEVVDAISYLNEELTPTGEDPIDAFQSELGDLLFQVIFHSCLATESGWFDLTDVANTLHDKLERRHPHVFGSVAVADADEVKANWDQIKAEERGGVVDPFAKIPNSLPALLWSSKVLKVCAELGLKPSTDRFGAVDLLRAHTVAGSAEGSDAQQELVLGDSLLELVAEGRRLGIDPEIALRRAAARVRDGFASDQTS